MIEAILTFLGAILLVWIAFSVIGNVLHAALFILAVVVVYLIIRSSIERYSRKQYSKGTGSSQTSCIGHAYKRSIRGVYMFHMYYYQTIWYDKANGRVVEDHTWLTTISVHSQMK